VEQRSPKRCLERVDQRGGHLALVDMGQQML
jgi:hypothetical protein